jgi:DNA-binding transcriptional regulator YdaS (Cro superfamily)
MQLADYLGWQSLSHSQFAEIIKSSPSAVSLWATGQRIPRPFWMAAIKRATNEAVTADDFHHAA